MKEFVIYTVMVGHYGEIHQPEVTDDRFDYLLFTNDMTEDIGVWQIRQFPEVIQGDNKRLSRYPKTHPTELLIGYKASLYIDANLQILERWVYERFLELYNSNVNIAGVQLIATGRDCIYRHSYDMCVLGAEHDKNAIVQMHELRKRGFPDHFGLNENNCIWRRHNDFVKQVDDEWWWWIQHYSYRDQFSYMYCLWRYGVKRSFFLPQGQDTGSSGVFKRYHHNEDPSVASKKWVTVGKDEAMRNWCRNISRWHYRHYCFQWVLLSYLPFPKLMLLLFGYIALIPCSLFFAIREFYKRIR